MRIYSSSSSVNHCIITGQAELHHHVKAFVTEREEDTFYFDRTHLQEYIKASEGSRTHIPGYNYLAKINSFILISVIIMRLES